MQELLLIKYILIKTTNWGSTDTENWGMLNVTQIVSLANIPNQGELKISWYVPLLCETTVNVQSTHVISKRKKNWKTYLPPSILPSL